MFVARSWAAFFIFSTLVLVAAAAANRGTSTAYSGATVEQSLISQQQSDGSFGSNIKDTHFVVGALSKLGLSVPKKDDVCKYAKAQLATATTVEAVYHAVSVVEHLKCGEAVTKATSDLLKNTIKDSESLYDLYYATNAVLDLQESNHITFEGDLGQVVNKITILKEDDQTFKANEDAEQGSFFNAGLASHLLARLYKKASSDDKEAITETADELGDLLSSATDADGVLFFEDLDESVSNVQATGAVLRGLVALSNAVDKTLNIKPEQLSKIAEYLVQSPSKRASDVYYLAHGLNAAAKASKIGAPIAVSLQKATVTAGDKDSSVRIQVSDVLGKPISGVKVVVAKAYPTGTRASEATELSQTLDVVSSNEPTVYSFGLQALRPEPGFYTIEVRASADKHGSVERSVSAKVTGAITITDFEISVAADRDHLLTEPTKYTAEFNKTAGREITIPSNNFVRVSFRVRQQGSSNRAILVQQAVVRFFSAESNTEVYLAAVPNDQKVYTVDVNLVTARVNSFLGNSGKYSVHVIVADAFVQNPIDWLAAVVQLSFPGGKVERLETLSPLPTIEHQFRVPEKRPSTFVSQIFTAAVLAPLGLFLIGLLTLGANIGRLPSGADSLSALLFVASLGGVLGVIVLFWLSLNMIQALIYLSFASLPALFFGQRTLRALTVARKTKVQ